MSVEEYEKEYETVSFNRFWIDLNEKKHRLSGLYCNKCKMLLSLNHIMCCGHGCSGWSSMSKHICNTCPPESWKFNQYITDYFKEPL